MALMQALRDLLARLAQGRVQGGQHQIQACQEFIGIIQRAVGFDLHFGGMQDQNAVAKLLLASS